MSYQLYKEGQGTWARGLLAFVIGITGIFAAVKLRSELQAYEFFSNTFSIPLIGWAIGWSDVLAVVVTLPFISVGVWLYNKPKIADFLIETEGELATKVTWPTRKETVNNSIVVLVVCVLLAVWVTMADYVFNELREYIYKTW